MPIYNLTLANLMPILLLFYSTFFGSEISQFHYEFSEAGNISHILLHSRCSPVWLNKNELPISVSRYQLLSKAQFLDLVQSREMIKPGSALLGQKQNFGRSSCL